LKRHANKEDEDDDDSDNDDFDANAGSVFGGREEKKQTKKRSKKLRFLALQLQLWLAYWYAIMSVWRAVIRRVFGREPKRWRSASWVVSSLRRRVSRAMRNAIPREPFYSTLEMDTDADTCVLGPNFVLPHYTGRECDVSPYTEVYESVKAVPIVSGARFGLMKG
jgi:hypothetical protein